MSQEQDQSQKTEEATPRKLQDARDKGKVITSQEVSHLAIMIGGALIAGVLGPYMAKHLFLAAGGIFDKFHAINIDSANIGNLFSDMLLQLIIGLGPLIFVLLSLAICSYSSPSRTTFVSLLLSPSLFVFPSALLSREHLLKLKDNLCGGG